MIIPNLLSDYANSYSRASTQYLSRLGSDLVINGNTFTMAGCFKRGSTTGAIMGLFQKFSATTGRDQFRIQLDASNRFMFLGRTANEQAARTTNLSFPPAIPNTWQNWVAHWERANATANDRIKIWINGTLITSFATIVNPTTGMQAGDSAPWEIGRSGNASNTWDGLIGHTMYFGGALVPPAEIFNGAGPPMEEVRVNPNLLLWQTSQNILLGAGTAPSAVYDEKLGNWTNNNTATTTTDNPVTSA